MAITLDKVIQVDPISMQIVTAGLSVLSAEYDVSQTRVGRVFFDVANIGNGNPTPPKLEVQVSQKASGNDAWVVGLQRMSMQLPGGAGTTVGVNVFANDTFFNVTNVWGSSGYLPQRWIFFNDVVFVNSEWANVTLFASPTTTVRDPIQFSHLSTDGLACGARYSYEVDLSSVKRMRIAVYNNSTRGTGLPLDHVVHVGLMLTGAVNG